MYCPYCGKKLTGAPKFCIYCGCALEKEEQQGPVPAEMAQPASEAQAAAPMADTAHVLADTAPVKAKAPVVAPGKRRGRRIAALCAVILLAAGVSVGSYWGYRQYRVRSLCEEASEARAQWRVQDAACAWREALALQPACTEAYLGLSEVNRIFSNTTNAILILNDGLAAGADSTELNRALDELCGPDVIEHSILFQIPDDSIVAFTLSRYSRNGNLLYQTDDVGFLDSGERQISPEDDTLRPASFAREDGTATRTYDALGLLASENYSGPEYTQEFEWTNDSETGLPLSYQVAYGYGGVDGSISQTIYEYDYADGRLASLTVTNQFGDRGEELTPGNKKTYFFTYSGTPAAVTVTASADSPIEDYLVELDEHGFLSKKQPVAYGVYGPVWLEFSYEGDGQLVEVSTTDGVKIESTEIRYDENRRVSGLYHGEEQLSGPIFPEE